MKFWFKSQRSLIYQYKIFIATMIDSWRYNKRTVQFVYLYQRGKFSLNHEPLTFFFSLFKAFPSLFLYKLSIKQRNSINQSRQRWNVCIKNFTARYMKQNWILILLNSPTYKILETNFDKVQVKSNPILLHSSIPSLFVKIKFN